MRFPGAPLAPTLTHDAPTKVIAGDSIEFLVSIPGGYETWTGSARITGPQNLDATSCATEGTDFHVYFKGLSGTDNLEGGQYTLSVFAKNGNDRKTIGQYGLTIADDLSAIDAPVQSHAVRMLTQIEAVLEFRMTGRKSGPLESYTIDGRSMQDMPTAELYSLRAKYSAEVAAEQNADKPIGSVKFGFPPAIPTHGPWPFGDPRIWLR